MGRRRIKLSTMLIHGPLVAMTQGLVKAALDGGGPRRKPAVEPEPPKPAQTTEPLPPATPAEGAILFGFLFVLVAGVAMLITGSPTDVLISSIIVVGIVALIAWRKARHLAWACIVLCAIAAALLLAA